MHGAPARLVAAGLAALLLSACREVELEPATRGGQFDCGDLTFTADVQPDAVHVRLPSRELVLREFVGATGPRYSDGRSTLWFEGERVTLEYDDRTYVCERVPTP